MRIAVLLGDLARDAALVPGTPLGEVDRTSFEALERALSGLDHEVLYLRSHAHLVDDLRGLRGRVDLVLNLCDEGIDNRLDRELHAPALLDLLDLPYTGGAPRCLACCFDKALVRSVAADLGIRVARGVLVPPAAEVAPPPFGFPAFVKPNFGDGSYGITVRSVVHDGAQLAGAVSELRSSGYQGPILVEELLEGADVDVGAVGNRGAWRFFPFATVDYRATTGGAPAIQSREFKWDDVSPYASTEIVRASLPPDVEAAIRDGSERLLDRLGCRDYARIDWRLDGAGRPHLLEVNPNTGWGASGRLADMAAMADVSYRELLAAIIDAAARRLRQHGP